MLYSAAALGAVGVGLALPRRRRGLEFIGLLFAAVAAGAVVLAMSLAAGVERMPTVFFYAFAAVGLGAALRTITHPRPVYSALYFIMTIIATAGLFLLLSAEFMAFALVIIYAGAILITYLFVIMLATQAPSENDIDLQAEYDVQAREPWVAAAVGFVVLGVLTGVMARGVGQLPVPNSQPEDIVLTLPNKVEKALRRAPEGALLAKDATLVRDGDVLALREGTGALMVEGADASADIPADVWRPAVEATNVERLGINLLRDHPMTIEIAGVILLMAMLGATVLARKQVEIEEMLKAHEARRLHDAASERTGAGA